MGYISKKGEEAATSAQQENDFSKALFSLKSGTSVKVRAISTQEIAEVFMHNVFGVFYSTPCLSKDELYEKAAKLLKDDQKKAEDSGDSKLAEQLGKHSYNLVSKPRYLMGFISLDTGEPIIIDLSKKQSQAVITTIKKYEKKLDVLAFEISKNGTGQSTSVTFNPLMFLDEDLTEKQRKHFDESKGKEIPAEVYENCLYVKKEKEHAQDVLDYEAYAKKGSKNLPPIELHLNDRLDLESYVGAPSEPGVDEAEPIDPDSENEYDENPF